MDIELKLLGGMNIVGQLLLIIAMISCDRKIPVIWEEEAGHLWGVSFLWIKMNTFKRKKVLKYLFLSEDNLDYKTKRVPLWAMFLKSKVYINIISFIMTIIFFSKITIWIQTAVIFLTFISLSTCIIIVPIIEYLLWRFIIHKERYIEKFIILRVIFWYIIMQIPTFYFLTLVIGVIFDEI